MEFDSYLLLLAIIFGFMMAWGVGANDVANAMGTSVGSKAVSIRQAIIIATIFEFAGAIFAGGQVTSTIHSGILELSVLQDTPNILIYGMLAALLAAAIWLFIASHFGWPVSTTHTIVGAIVGFGAFSFGMPAVQWSKIFYITLSWVISPVCGGIISYLLFQSMQFFIFNTQDPISNAKRVAPYYIFGATWVVAMVTFVRGLQHIGYNSTFLQSAGLALLVSILVTLIGIYFLSRVKVDESDDMHFHFANVEKIFSVLMIFTACAMAFAHGSNDVANAIGPLATVASVISSGGKILTEANVPSWTLFLGAVGIVTGLITYGHKVIATIGKGITELTPSRGFAATLSAASTVVIASGTGLPISTTHTLVGSILGVGIARGIAAINLNVIRSILASWVITLPAGAILAIILFSILKFVFS